MELSKLSDSMNQLRQIVSSLKEPVPPRVRMLILTRAQRILAELCDTATQLAPSERGSIVAAVLEVQAWTQRQLKVGRARAGRIHHARTPPLMYKPDVVSSTCIVFAPLVLESTCIV